MKFSTKHIKLLFLITLILSFLLNSLISSLISITVMVLTIIYESKLRKSIINWGFAIFISFVILLPLATSFSLEKFIENTSIVSRGIIFLFLLFFVFQDIESSKTYRKLEKILPNEIKISIKTALKLFPNIKNILVESWQEYKQNKKFSSKNIIKIFEKVIYLAENLSTDIEASNRPKIHIITGKVHQGKSAYAYKLADKLVKKGFRVGGVISKSINKDDQRIGYEIIDLKSGKSISLATVDQIANPAEICGRFYFYKEGFEFANKVLDLEYMQNTDIAFIDEVGWLELEGKGFYKSLNQLSGSDISTIIIVVREELVDKVKEKFDIIPQKVIRI